MPQALVGLAVVLGLLLTHALARANGSRCDAQQSWVSIQVSGIEREFTRRVVNDLRAGLAPGRIEACTAEEAGPSQPLAVVKITRGAGQSYSVDVSDSVTRKRIGRDVDLAHVPEDGRAFALAVATEELLRASWAELALAGAKAPPQPKAQPTKSPSTPARRAPPKLGSAVYQGLGLGLGFEGYTGGQVHFGPELFWFEPLAHWLSLGLGLGYRCSLSVQAPHGTVTARALGAELSLLAPLVSSRVFRLEVAAGLRGARVWYTATPTDAAQALDQSGYALYARSGLVMRLGLAGGFRSSSRLGLGGPVKSYSASDAGMVVTGVTGVELLASTGLLWEF